MVHGFKKIFAATVIFGTDGDPSARPLFHWARFHFFDDAHLWFNRPDLDIPISSDEWRNTVTLSQPFYDEIQAHPIPVEREAVAILASAPGVLDLYIWLVWESWNVKTDLARVPLFGNGGLTSQLGCGQYSCERFFRRKLSAWLRRVVTIWPQCPARISKDGSYLLVEPSRKTPPIVRCLC